MSRVAGRFELLELVAQWGPQGWECPQCGEPTNSYGHHKCLCKCGVSKPDTFGNRDLLEHPECPLHGAAS